MKERLLTIDAPHFCAGSVWRYKDGNWQCTDQVAPIIKWVKNKKWEELEAYLKRKQWKYYWTDIGE